MKATLRGDGVQPQLRNDSADAEASATHAPKGGAQGRRSPPRSLISELLLSGAVFSGAVFASAVLPACTQDPQEYFARAGAQPEGPGLEVPQPSNGPAPSSDEAGVSKDDPSPSSDDGEDRSDDPDDDPAPSPADTDDGETDDAIGSEDSGLPTIDASAPVSTADAGPMTPSPAPAPDPGPTEQDFVAACGDAPVSNAEFTRAALRGAAADCAVYNYCRFSVVAEELNRAVSAWRSSPSDDTLERARSAFREAMTAWSNVELFQFGPLASRAESAGKDMYHGQGIRELIYSWPSVSRCRVEEQLVTGNYASRGMDSVLISARGLFALETVLFSDAAQSDCAPQSATAVAWAELGASEREERKRDYAAAVAADIVTQTQRLLEAWSPSGGNFRAILVDGSGDYPSEQEALKVMAWSLVYLEREVKDWKVGIPAGYTLTHPVTLPETPYAKLGIDAIVANLHGFRSLFQGCGASGQGLGFDDWLSAAGHEQLALDMVAAWVTAERTASELPSLESASPAQLEELYQALRGLTSLLKADLFGDGSPLGLDLPGGVEGDTD